MFFPNFISLIEVFDILIGKIETQVRRFLDKAQNHHHENLASIAASGDVEVDDDEDEDME